MIYLAYTTGYISTSYDLIEAINDLLLSVGWKSVVSDTTTYSGATRLCYGIWEGEGDGNDKIYIQAKIYDDDPKSIAIDSMAGFDPLLYYFEQPGSLQQWLKSDGETKVNQPCISVLENELMYYWLFADSYRLIGVYRMSIQYESFYVGFLNPIASERQYPYPMYVCGDASLLGNKWPSNPSGSFVFPYQKSGFVRRVDGTWREFVTKPLEPDPYSVGTVFPYNTHNKKLIPNYKGKSDSSIIQDNFLMLPIILQTTDPIDMLGLLRGVYWVSGTRDLAAEQTFECEGVSYIAFDTKQHRDNNSYFCIKME